MARFDLLYEQSFTNTDTIPIIHNLDRYSFDVRLVIDGDPRLSKRELIQDVDLDPLDPLNKCEIRLRAPYSGVVQFIAEDTLPSPYYTVDEKLSSQQSTDVGGTAPIKFEYGGNSKVGRYLEYRTARSSFEAPFPVISDGKIRGVVFQADTAGVGSFGIYAKRPLVSDILLYTMSYQAVEFKIDKILDIDILENDQIYVVQNSGTSQKPYIGLYIQTF